MKLILLCAITALPLFAQAPPDNSVTGSVDVGYRWRSGVGGSFDTYRSIVDLGSGLKLLSTDFTLIDPSKRLFDKLNVRALNLGDDPYESVHLDASKETLYRFSADYRNIAYFNNLPSYADPLPAGGIGLNEQSFDTHRRIADFNLDLLPAKWLKPYLAFNRSSSYGTGVATFASDANEYAVSSRMNDATDQFRGGAHIELKRFHVTLEQGGGTYRDDQNLFSGPGINSGNRTTPLLGKTLSLGNLIQDEGVRGTSIYSKGLVTASVTPWLDLFGQFLFSQAQNDLHLSDTATGNFVVLNQLLFYSSQQYLIGAQAKLPHTTASFGAEIRPLRRLRIMESLLTDRLHDSGSGTPYATGLVENRSQEQADVFFELTSHFTLRGGFRHEWGDGSQFLIPADSLASKDSAPFSQNVGTGGIAFHGGQKFSANVDAEVGSSNDAYFRTSLHNFQKIRARARYQLTSSLNLAADFTFLNNDNPAVGVHYESQIRQESISMIWIPQASKRWDVQTSYDRSAIQSNITYLVPQDLSSAISSYSENGHSITALVEANLPAKTKLSLGGAAFISSGSRPSTYYQPVARVSGPAGKGLSWFGEWAWYGFGEGFYQYESFHAHLLTGG